MTLRLVDGFYSSLKLDRNGFDRGLLLSIWDTILSKIHVEYRHNNIIIFLSPQVKRSLIISNKLVNASCLTSCRTV